jgi:hypothetical protein
MPDKIRRNFLSKSSQALEFLRDNTDVTYFEPVLKAKKKKRPDKDRKSKRPAKKD